MPCPIGTRLPMAAPRNSAARRPSTTSSRCSPKPLRLPATQLALSRRASCAVTPKQVMIGWPALETMPNSTGSACSTMGQAAICRAASPGTLLKNRSETSRSKTIAWLPFDRIPENILTAPCRIVTTVSMAATLKAMPAMLSSERTRWRRRFVTMSLKKIIAALPRPQRRRPRRCARAPPRACRAAPPETQGCGASPPTCATRRFLSGSAFPPGQWRG